jgi:serine/threonine protein kinase
MIVLTNQENLKHILTNNFENILWKDKIKCLYDLIYDLQNTHKLGYFFKDIKSENILYNYNNNEFYISDYNLSGLESENNKIIFGVLPYIAPEVLSGESYTPSSDIYSFGIIMTELSSGKVPFHDRKYDLNLALDICNGCRPEFGKGTPEFYKKLAYKCMNAHSNERPKSNELYHYFKIWNDILNGKIFSHKRKTIIIDTILLQADKEILNISTLYEIDPASNYTSRELSFLNLPKPINSSIINSYLEKKSINDESIYFSNLIFISNYKKKIKNKMTNIFGTCSYCNKILIEELWCNKCDPYHIIEKWTSGNNEIDKFIKDTIYNARNIVTNPIFLEWVPFDRFTDIKQIGKGGFAKVYSAIWISGKSSYRKRDDGMLKLLEPEPIKVALKKLNDSENMSAKYLSEVYFILCFNVYVILFIKIIYLFKINFYCN